MRITTAYTIVDYAASRKACYFSFSYGDIALKPILILSNVFVNVEDFHLALFHLVSQGADSCLAIKLAWTAVR